MANFRFLGPARVVNLDSQPEEQSAKSKLANLGVPLRAARLANFARSTDFILLKNRPKVATDSSIDVSGTAVARMADETCEEALRYCTVQLHC